MTVLFGAVQSEFGGVELPRLPEVLPMLPLFDLAMSDVAVVVL